MLLSLPHSDDTVVESVTVWMIIIEQDVSIGGHLFELDEITVSGMLSMTSIDADEVTSNVREVFMKFFNRACRISPRQV